MNNTYSLIVHGGAGDISKMPQEKLDEYKNAIHEVGQKGKELLQNGTSALDVVETLVSLMEDNPIFNAGKGAVLNDEGGVTMDASIMNGIDMNVGSVAGITNVKNPIKFARLIMEKSEHVLLISKGALEYAKSLNVPMESEDYFITEFRKKQQEEARSRGKAVLDHDGDQNHKKYGTVGAVARDIHGNIAAATSTGGISNMKFGRVGDSPIIGAGTWADNETCGVSCTGYGEQFIRTGMAKTVADFIFMKDMNAQEAAEAAINYLVKKVKGLGGLIVVDKNGNIGQAFSSKGMIRSWCNQDQEVRSELL